eukprot:6258661-Alexandrium_andersonii.AAC.1
MAVLLRGQGWTPNTEARSSHLDTQDGFRRPKAVRRHFAMARSALWTAQPPAEHARHRLGA